MPNTGPIIIIDDDADDLNLIDEAFKSLDCDNEIILFENPQQSLDFLKKTDKQPFFILCDVNMHQFNGFDLRQELNKDENLRVKSIPFLFLSTAGDEAAIKYAYKLSVQGYFKKPISFDGIRDMLQSIISYWANCLHPNSP
jgi:CheY-like chemotaxis protein